MDWLFRTCGISLYDQPPPPMPKSLQRFVAKRMLPHLFIASGREAGDIESLRALKIQHILNVSPGWAVFQSLFPNDFEVTDIPVSGRYLHSVLQHFEEIDQLIVDVKKKKERCCIVCKFFVSIFNIL